MAQPRPPRAQLPTLFGEASDLGELKRRLYQLVALLGTGTMLLLGLLALYGPDRDPHEALGRFMVLAGWLAILALLSTRRTPLWLVERGMLGCVAVLFLTRLVLELAGDDRVPGSLHTLLFLALLAYISMERALAARLVAGLYVVGAAAPLATLLFGTPARSEPLVQLLAGYLVGAMLLVLLHGLSWFRERLTSEHLTVRQLRSLVRTDPLTGVTSRRHLYELLHAALRTAKERGTPLGVVLLDLDRFKAINDQFGHNTGDAVLQGAATALENALGPRDHIGRWGGEEFLILLPGRGPAEAVAFAEELRSALRARKFATVGRVTASFGVACARSGDTVERLVGRADASLYRAKERGRDRVELEEGSAVHLPRSTSR